MRLYGNATGANVRRVSIYLAEKGLSLERVDVDMAAGEHKSPEFKARNPAGQLPVLELDDGSYLPESSAIVEYLEDLHPTPSFRGRTPEQAARVRAMERISSDLSLLTVTMLEHEHPYFAARLTQNPGVVEGLKPKVEGLLAVLETQIGDDPFLAGDEISLADCTLFPLIQTCRVRMKTPFAEEFPRLSAWYDRFAARPSAAY